MSGLMNKIKEVVSGDKHHETTDTTGTHGHGHHGLGQHSTSGPHTSDVANKADPRVDSDRDGSRNLGATGAGYGSSTSTGTGMTGGLTGSSHTTAGPHSSDLANRADPRVDSDRDGRSGLAGSHTGTSGGMLGGLTGGSHHTAAGPHSSDLANRADPRVDSDRDGRSGLTGTGMGATGTGPTGTGVTGGHSHSHGLHDVVGHHHPHEGFDGRHGGTGHHTTMAGEALDPNIPHGGSSGMGASGTAGPHSSNLLNKMDPRVDSDRDGSRNMGATGAGYGTSTGSGMTGSGYGTSTGSGMTGSGMTGSGMTGSGYGSSTGSGMTGSGMTGSGMTGSGYGSSTGSGMTGGQSTAGPHNSNLLNKMDPRVDSDMDRSRRV